MISNFIIIICGQKFSFIFIFLYLSFFTLNLFVSLELTLHTNLLSDLNSHFYPYFYCFYFNINILYRFFTLFIWRFYCFIKIKIKTVSIECINHAIPLNMTQVICYCELIQIICQIIGIR